MIHQNTIFFRSIEDKDQSIIIDDSYISNKYILRYIPQIRQPNGKPINYTMLIDFYYNGLYFCSELAYFEYLDKNLCDLFLNKMKNPFIQKTFQIIEYDLIGVTMDIPVVIIQANNNLKQIIDAFINTNNKYYKHKQSIFRTYCIRLEEFTIEQISRFFPIGTCIEGTYIYIKKNEI